MQTDLISAPIPKTPSFQNLSGRVFNQWTVIDYGGDRHWNCRCKCGSLRRILRQSLVEGRSKSCGCESNKLKALRSTTHGMSETLAYRSYANAKGRCTNPNDTNFHNYGGRGIEFRFSSFEEFFAEVGPRPTVKHSIERKDGNKHYEKGNVHWTDSVRQNRNLTKNVCLTCGGETKPMSEWAETLNKTHHFLYGRYRRGWCTSCTLTLPKNHKCTHIEKPVI